MTKSGRMVAQTVFNGYLCQKRNTTMQFDYCTGSAITKDLMAMLDASPVNFLAVDYVARQFKAAGFTELDSTLPFPRLETGKGYFIQKNHSSLYVFRKGNKPVSETGFRLIAAHCDSPCFRIKPMPEMVGEGGIVRLNTELYGGAILYTWFDRPLSLAGRVLTRGNNPLCPITHLLHIKRPLLVIPHLAIHFNRAVNEGNPLSKQKDMLPVLGLVKDEMERNNLLVNLIASELGVKVSEILDFDLYLYDTTPACLVGLHGEFINSGRLDDLSMVHAGVSALLNCNVNDATQVLAIFDNEETGSGTKQGAHSPVLRHLLERIVLNEGGNTEDFYRSIERSFMVSADNAHGLHPNYVEKQDPTNHPVLGGGPVIKYNANQKYATDADSAAVFAEICRKAGVPFQYFVNHSDVAGGSTLGNILTAQLPFRGVDMGNAIWAMHSVRETGAAIDQEYVVRAFTEFYNVSY